MATILEFPSQEVQGFNFLEARLKEMLESKGADEELIEFALRTVRETYENTVKGEDYSFNLTLPEEVSPAAAETLQSDIETALTNLRANNHALVVRLVAELALAQLTIFQYERIARQN